MKKNSFEVDEQGFVLITAMFFLILVTIIGIMATDMTTVELQIAANDRIYKSDFYDQEMVLAAAKVNHRDWMTTEYLNPETGDESTSRFPDKNDDDLVEKSLITKEGVTRYASTLEEPQVIGGFKVRNIHNLEDSSGNPINVPDWDDNDQFGGADKHPANHLPALSHRDKPLPGTGYDPKNFEIRRFAITAYSTENDRKVILQEGIFKAFNRY
ncbi:MAG: hypothetical protein GX751_11955 [Desulfuromonadaceae bacterium]|nr:hypothetical protein [Desulfuromonadaceae bacterium]